MAPNLSLSVRSINLAGLGPPIERELAATTARKLFELPFKRVKNEPLVWRSRA